MKKLRPTRTLLCLTFMHTSVHTVPLKIVKEYNPGKELLACAMEKHLYGIVNPLNTHEFVQYQKEYVRRTAIFVFCNEPNETKQHDYRALKINNLPINIFLQKTLVFQ